MVITADSRQTKLSSKVDITRSGGHYDLTYTILQPYSTVTFPDLSETEFKTMLANKLLARFKNLAAANPNTTVTVSSRLKSKPFKKSFSYLAATDAEGEKFEGLVKSVVAVIVGQLK